MRGREVCRDRGRGLLVFWQNGMADVRKEKAMTKGRV